VRGGFRLPPPPVPGYAPRLGEKGPLGESLGLSVTWGFLSFFSFFSDSFALF